MIDNLKLASKKIVAYISNIVYEDPERIKLKRGFEHSSPYIDYDIDVNQKVFIEIRLAIQYDIIKIISVTYAKLPVYILEKDRDILLTAMKKKYGRNLLKGLDKLC